MRTLFRSILANFAVIFLGAHLLLAGGLQPEASINQEAQGAARTQRACPVMGGEIGPIDKALYVDVKGKRIYICCAACENAILADPDTYIEKIEKRGETVVDAPKSGPPPNDKTARD